MINLIIIILLLIPFIYLTYWLFDGFLSDSKWYRKLRGGKWSLISVRNINVHGWRRYKKGDENRVDVAEIEDYTIKK